MKKVYILAALLMATTSAHAGNAVSADTQGKRIEIELAAAGDSAPAPGPDAHRFNDENDAEPGRPGFHEGGRFYDDDRAPGPGRPDFESGRAHLLSRSRSGTRTAGIRERPARLLP